MKIIREVVLLENNDYYVIRSDTVNQSMDYLLVLCSEIEKDFDILATNIQVVHFRDDSYGLSWLVSGHTTHSDYTVVDILDYRFMI